MNLQLGSNAVVPIILGCLTSLSVFAVIRLIFHGVTIEIEDETAALVIRFGQLVKTYFEPGLHFIPSKLLPWVKVIGVSLHRDFREYQKISVNDCRGTTVIIDFWVEFRITNPEKALFQVENWEQSLQSLLTHSATSILCTQDFKQILSHRQEFGDCLRNDIKTETARWGIEIEMVMVQKVSLLPEVSRQMFATVAAKLERFKANFQEEGRLRAAHHEAKITAKIAALVAEAKGQYPAAIGRAYSELSANPAVLKAYQELYDLSVVRPHTTVSFQGFSKNEIREIDAAMINLPQREKLDPEVGAPFIQGRLPD